MNTQQEQEEVKATDLKIYSLTDAGVTQLVQNYKGLTIAGPDDKDGYAAVTRGIKELTAVRNKIDKRRLEVNKHTNDEAKRIMSQLGPLEDALRSQKQGVDDIIEKKRQEAEAALLTRFTTRKNRLANIGATFNGMVWSIGVAFLDENQIKMLPDDIFEINYNGFKAAAEKRDAAKAEADKQLAQFDAEKLQFEKEKKLLALKEAMFAKREELALKVVNNTIEPGFTVLINATQDGLDIQFTPKKITHKYEMDLEARKEVETIQNGASVYSKAPDEIKSILQDGFNQCRNKMITYITGADKLTRATILETLKALEL